MFEVPSYSVLRQANHESVHAKQQSLNLITDITASKRLSVSHGWTLPRSKIEGFVQDIVLDPFGFLLLSSIQVRLSDQQMVKNIDFVGVRNVAIVGCLRYGYGVPPYMLRFGFRLGTRCYVRQVYVFVD